jgi:hypothetical protein
MPNPSKSQFSTLEIRRQNLLQQLAGLRQIRRGSLTQQFFMVKRKDGSRVKRGPYPLITRKEGQKTVSQRLSDPKLLALYRQQIDGMRQFEKVVNQIVQIGEQFSDLAVAEQVQKKTRNRTGTERGGASSGAGHGQPSHS